MGFMDDLKARAQQEFEEVKTDVNTYLNQRVASQVVKIAQPKTGNLTAAQVEAGARGSVDPVVQPGFEFASGMDMKAMIVPLLIVGAIAFYMMKKRRG